MITDIKGHIWNIRFKIGWRILPGNHKHVAVFNTTEEPCSKCADRSELRSLLERAHGLV